MRKGSYRNGYGHVGLLGSTWAILGPSWVILGSSWDPLGVILGHLEFYLQGQNGDFAWEVLQKWRDRVAKRMLSYGLWLSFALAAILGPC